MSPTPTTHRPAAPVAAFHRWSAILIFILTLCLVALAAGMRVLNNDALANGLLNFLILLLFAGISALVVARRAARVGWLIALGTLCFALQVFAYEYAWYALETTPQALPGGLILGWLAVWIVPLALALTFTFPFLLFPTGRLLSPRWRWVVGYVVFALVFEVLLGIFQPTFRLTATSLPQPNPFGLTHLATLLKPLAQTSTLLNTVSIIFAVAAAFWRFRRATGIERQQIKWVAYAALFFLIAYFFTGLLDSFTPLTDNPLMRPVLSVTGLVFAKLALAAFPLALGAAILRYRLWDIDFLVNRSLVYGALSLAVAAIFGLSLWLISFIVQGQSFTLAFGLTALVAGLLFNPARRRLQRLVDQQLYHIYIDYQKVGPILSTGHTQILRQTYFGAYQNLELIGHGGMAEVYKATHPTLKTPVAIKILPARLATEPDFRQRFTREAQMVACLQHRNIVRVFDYGEQDQTLYMVMEYVPGQDLGAFIKQAGRISLTQTQEIVQQIAAALDYAHTQGMVHRDIKPSNVILEPASSLLKFRAVLMDFGIAKMVNADTAMTQAGSMLGTLDYIAPEQIQAQPQVDGRADIYALGVMTYQMLTGELPFKQQNPGALLIAHLTQPPPNAREVLPGLPRPVATALQRAMSKKVEDRFPTATDFAQSLGEHSA